MSKLIVSVPVWGADYMRTFERCAAPALRYATALHNKVVGERVHFVVHTDNPEAARRALSGPYDPDASHVEVRPIAPKPTYVALQEGHADAVRQAAVGDRVILLNADIVVSGNFINQCSRHLARGKLAVVLLGIRTTMSDDYLPPVGAAPRELLDWAWRHRHQIIRDLEYPGGGSMLPTNLFWARGDAVVARGFHLHPAAIVKQEHTDFKSTIDGDLLDCFPREAIHVVTSADDCAMLEVSPPGKRFPVRPPPQTPAMVAAAMRTRASAMHAWLFEHAISVRDDRAHPPNGVAAWDDSERAALLVLDALRVAQASPPRPDRKAARVRTPPRLRR